MLCFFYLLTFLLFESLYGFNIFATDMNLYLEISSSKVFLNIKERDGFLF